MIDWSEKSDEYFYHQVTKFSPTKSRFLHAHNYVFPFKVYHLCVIQTLDPFICAYAYKKTKNLVYKNPEQLFQFRQNSVKKSTE